MNKPYIAIIGTYNDITTERIVNREFKVEALDKYDAHKVAMFKCDTKEGQIVLQILDYNKSVLFDFLKGFTS